MERLIKKLPRNTFAFGTYLKSGGFKQKTIGRLLEKTCITTALEDINTQMRELTLKQIKIQPLLHLKKLRIHCKHSHDVLVTMWDNLLSFHFYLVYMY